MFRRKGEVVCGGHDRPGRVGKGRSLLTRGRGHGIERETAHLVRRFYDEIWNSGDRGAVYRLLAPDIRFRGSLGSEMVGHEAFWDYVCHVRGSLANYRCEIVELLCEGGSAAARMIFSGVHVGQFLGTMPAGSHVQWAGAAFFHLRGARISSVWVLGDLDALRRQLLRP